MTNPYISAFYLVNFFYENHLHDTTFHAIRKSQIVIMCERILLSRGF